MDKTEGGGAALWPPLLLLAGHGFGTDARPGPEGGRGRLSGWDTTESVERSRRAASIPHPAPGTQLIGEYEGSGVGKPVFLVRRTDGQVIRLSRLLPLGRRGGQRAGRIRAGDITAVNLGSAAVAAQQGAAVVIVSDAL